MLPHAGSRYYPTLRFPERFERALHGQRSTAAICVLGVQMNGMRHDVVLVHMQTRSVQAV